MMPSKGQIETRSVVCAAFGATNSYLA